jgi:hypothetical protein
LKILLTLAGFPDVSFESPVFHWSELGGQFEERCLTVLDLSLADVRKTDVCVYAPALPSQNQDTK